MSDSLVINAVNMLLNQKTTERTTRAAPAEPVSNTIKPGEAMKRVAERLSELQAIDLSDLKEQKHELQEKIAEEQKIIDAATFDLRKELEAKADRTELAQRRAAADLAFDVMQVLEEQLEGIEESIQTIVRQWRTKRGTVLGSLRNLAAAHRHWLRVYVNPDRSEVRLNPDRTVMQMTRLIGAENIAMQTLDDPELVADVIAEVTTYKAPDRLQQIIFDLLTPRDRARDEFSKYIAANNLTTEEQ